MTKLNWSVGVIWALRIKLMENPSMTSYIPYLLTNTMISYSPLCLDSKA